MARERLTSFIPGDVLRVVLRCTNCEGEIAYSMKRSIPNVPGECPLCPQDWSQSVRYEDYKARVELLYRALELLSVADDGVFYDSAGDDESDWAPWTVRLVIEGRPSSRERVSPMSTPWPTARPTMAQPSPEMEREALVALYNATGGPNWISNDNWLSDVPISEWEGVTTDGNGRVTELHLGENQLSGEIPPELGNLINLTELLLANLTRTS